MTLAEWDLSIAALPSEQIQRLRAALAELKQYDDLHREFKWTGLWALDVTMDYELRRRPHDFEASSLDAETCAVCGYYEHACKSRHAK